MIRFDRPTAPAPFERRAGKLRGKLGATGPFIEIWKQHKPLFGQHQHGKCGYCESQVTASQDPDVEHFAPKAEVHDIGADPATWGTEARAGAPNLRRGSRTTIPRSATGYWWRAYDWSNYLLACKVCNTKYKGVVFPLAPAPPTGWSPAENDNVHRPLLLNCFDDDTPWRHFSFDAVSGNVIGRTPRGIATIATCGLHRETLRSARLITIEDVAALCASIADPAAHHAVSAVAWRAVAERGRIDRPFAGAARGVAEQLLGLAWGDIVAFAAGLSGSRPA